MPSRRLPKSQLLAVCAPFILLGTTTAHAEQAPLPMVEGADYPTQAQPQAIAVSPPRFEARLPFGVFVETMDVSNLSMTIDGTDIEALEGYELPGLSGTRDFVGVSFGTEAVHYSNLSVFLQVGLGGASGDDDTARTPIGSDGDMLDLELSSLFVLSTHMGVGYLVPVNDWVSVYAQGYAGLRSVSRTVDVSFMGSEIGTESAGEIWFDSGAQVGVRARIAKQYDLWAAWNERFPRSSGFVVGLGYYSH
jgi:hypothetical protein